MLIILIILLVMLLVGGGGETNGMATDFGIETARQRVIDAIHAGKWDSVDAQLTAYAAAVRADERHRAIGEVLQSLKECGGDGGLAPVRDCLGAVEGLR